MIIDGGSCTNVASTRTVEKLGLKTRPRPHPYKLLWLSEEKEMLVDRHVDLSFSVGHYSDTVCFDVVPMEAAHLLLGRPWQFDMDAQHSRKTNKYSFMFEGKEDYIGATRSPRSGSGANRNERSKS